MTPEQWGHIMARLGAIEVLALSVARQLRANGLREAFDDLRESQKTALLSTQKTDAELAMLDQQLDRIAQAIWG